MQLTSAATIGVLIAFASPVALADGQVTLRTAYYKERATRVAQPMLDAVSTVGDHGNATGYIALDAITSASAAAGADGEPFTELRKEFGGSYEHTLRKLKLSLQGRYSNEPDYIARFIGGGVSAELFGKNTVLSLGGGASFDDISNAGAQSPFATPIQGEMNTRSLFLGATQLLSQNALVGLSVDISSINGFQQNPYRTAITNQGVVPERHPKERLRQAYAVTGRYFVEKTETTLIAVYRYYRDDWEIRAHTPEVRLVQEMGSRTDFGFRFRYHTQNAASFFSPRYDFSDPMLQPYLTDDVKLSKFRTIMMESKLAVHGETFGLSGRWGDARFEGLLQYIVQGNRFGNALVMHFAMTVPFGRDY